MIGTYATFKARLLCILAEYVYPSQTCDRK